MSKLPSTIPAMIPILVLIFSSSPAIASENSLVQGHVAKGTESRTMFAEFQPVHGEPAGIWIGDCCWGDPFVKGRKSFQLLSGVYFSDVGLGPQTPRFDFVATSVRLGRMLNTPGCGNGLLRGNCELLLDVTVAPVFDGFGDIFVGPALLARYNFVREGRRLVPYVQFGAGMIYTDAHEDMTQMAIGQAFEFTLQTGVGVRYLINPRWSLDLEAGFIHISNADLAERNHGINSLGGSVGFTRFFGGRSR